MAVRGSPAKGVGWGDWREGSNPSFSAKKKAWKHNVFVLFSCTFSAFYPLFYPYKPPYPNFRPFISSLSSPLSRFMRYEIPIIT